MKKEKWIMELQLFAEEKTEKATPKKRKDAREKGQVLRSMEINSALILMACFAALKVTFPNIIKNLQKIYIDFLGGNISLEQVYSYPGIRKLGLEMSWSIIIIIGPFMMVALMAGLLANYVQVGFLFTTKPIAPQISRMNPIEGFKRIFSKRALVELLKSVIKLIIIGNVVYSELKDSYNEINGWIRMDIIKGAWMVGSKTFSIASKSALVLLVMAIFDYGYQWWEYEQNLKMTKQEIKEEYKQMEGDPMIRSRIREKQREFGMRRMMQEIPKADVIITNPIHYAVAISYHPEENDAPIVIAKGQDHLALKIKEIAQQNDIVITENKPLAQALYKSTEVGQAVPSELFHAVAEVLAFVYNLKGRTI